MTENMRIAVCKRPNHIEIQYKPVPSVNGLKVLVKVKACGVCGSDLAIWRGSGHKKYPYSSGHEFCGTVAEKGDQVKHLQIGQRVVIDPNLGCGECRYCRSGKTNLCDYLKTRPVKSNGGFSEYVALDSRMAKPVPEALSGMLAIYVEPLSCSLHAVRSLQPKAGETVAVFGLGTMGILTGIALQSSGAKSVFVETAESRRKMFKDILATSSLSPQELADSPLAGRLDAAIDCSGNPKAVALATRLLRKAGRLVLSGLAVNADQTTIPLIDITTKELEIKGAYLNPNTFEEAIQLAVEQKSVLYALKTECYALNDIAKAFERASCPEIHKVIVKP